MAAEERCMHECCVLWKTSFLGRKAPFDCGVANWSCISRSVKGDMLVLMVSGSAVMLIPCNLSRIFFWSFASRGGGGGLLNKV